MRLSQIIIILLIVGFISQFLYYYPNLPETIASHYDAAGQPNGWMSKQGFILVDGIILLVIVFEFTLLPLLIERVPDSMINLPNKEYWLAAERRAATFHTMRRYFEWFAVVLVILFIAVNQLVFMANLANQPLSTPGILTILGIFFVFVIIWVVSFLRSFYKVAP